MFYGVSLSIFDVELCPGSSILMSSLDASLVKMAETLTS
jgi:hypothetical protein